MTDSMLHDGLHLVWENVVDADGTSHLESHWLNDAGFVVASPAA
ncbi:hypothetical protein [Nocardioides sp. GY 10127]|nr:hypothetical protein [Nocardioides sp. GY 10127]